MKIEGELEPAVKAYATKIGLSITGYERLITLLMQAAPLHPEPISYILISEQSAPEGPKAFLNMLAFSHSYVYEFKNFLGAFNWDILGLNDTFYINIATNNYQFSQSEAGSVMSFTCYLGGGLNIAWQGLGINCEHGWEVIRDLLMPKVKALGGHTNCNYSSAERPPSHSA